jgi:hypothetical protein
MPIVRRLFRPGLADLLGLMLLFLVIVAGGRKLFGDADTATHVATGRYILAHHAIPRADPFSASFAGREWFAHEWLATIALAGAWSCAGWPGVVWLSALLIAAAHLLLYRHLVRRGDDALTAFVAVVAAASVASVHWLARPHLFTVLMLVIAVVLLEEVISGRRPRAWLFALPLVALVWVNLHGGFLILFPVLACYGAGIAVTRARRGLFGFFCLATAASAAATLVNPWGYRLVRHLVGFFAARGAALRHTDEFDPPTLDDRAGVTLAIFLALCLVGLGLGLATRLRARREGGRAGMLPAASNLLQPGTILAFLMTTVMALRSVRDVEIMAIFGAIVTADGLSVWLGARLGPALRDDLEAFRAREARSGGGLVGAALLVAAGLAVAGWFPPAGFDPSQFPVGMVERLKAAGIRPEGPVLTPDLWGGYLILEWPEAKVYVDGRWDMRGDAFYERYAGLMLTRPGWERILGESGIAWALLPPESPLARALRQDAGWTLWGSDGVTEAWVRHAASASFAPAITTGADSSPPRPGATKSRPSA